MFPLIATEIPGNAAVVASIPLSATPPALLYASIGKSVVADSLIETTRKCESAQPNRSSSYSASFTWNLVFSSRM